jgi:CPA1 family monovalent cation:H+ antiporter
MLATVLLIGAGNRLHLPYPVLMILLGVGLAFLPGLPDLEIPPNLILPLFLPPLLFATAQRTSWAVFRVRWRSILLLAVGLVAATVAAAAGCAWLLIPGIGLSTAVALGAVVSPPDPVAVESVAGPLRIPRRLVTVLQSEGLFNDATALVIFQTAVSATVSRTTWGADVALRFGYGALVAVVIGLASGWLVGRLNTFITDPTGRSALTGVVPFAVYLGAEELHASGVVAVVVVALQLRQKAAAEEAAERITGRAFWDVVEILVTGIAFGLMGLQLRRVLADAGDALPTMIGRAVVVCAVVIAVRTVWLVTGTVLNRRLRRGDPAAAPRTASEALVLTWCGMRGLATLALALALPPTLDDGSPFPARAEIIVIASAVLLATLVLPGLTLPALVRLLRIAEDEQEIQEAERVVAHRAQHAAIAALWENHELLDDLPEETATEVRERLAHLEVVLTSRYPPVEDVDRLQELQRVHDISIAAQTVALDAARREVLRARAEIGIDPEAADRVLRRLDLRTLLLH